MDSQAQENGIRKSRRFSLFAFFATLPNRIAAWIAASFLGRFFCGYGKVEEVFRESRTVRTAFRGRTGARLSRWRYRLASLSAKSKLQSSLHRLFTVLQQTRLRSYGLFLFTFGFYSCVIYLAEYYVLPLIEPEVSLLITGGVTLLLGIALLFNPLTLHEALDEEHFLGAFLYRVAGLRIYARKHRSKWQITYFAAFLLGSLFGVAGFFIHPLYLLGILAAISFFAVLIHSPEFSLLSAIFLAPFLIFFERPSLLLLCILLIGMLGYVGKLILGRRIFRFEPVDCGILALMAMFLASCLFTQGGGASVKEALLTCALMCGYFLAANLINTPDMLDRAISALLSGAGLVSFIGILQQLTGKAVANWLDSAAFDYISGRITSTFENPNVLAVYLILVLPFALSRMARGRVGERIGSSVTVILIMAALVFTWSRGAWISAAAVLVLFILLCRPSTVYILLPLGIATPFALNAWLPAIADRFSSSASLSDSSVFYRSELWQGVWKMIGDNFLGGIGMGEEAFTAIYPYYAHAGIEGATHAHNLYLQFFVSFGFLGPVLLVGALLLIFVCLFTHKKNERSADLQLLCIASVCSLLAVLINGFTDYVFYNYRVFFLFFAVCGIAVAVARVGRREHLRSIREDSRGATEYAVEVELID